MNKSNYVKSKNHINITPGESLRIIRELQELSQNELAVMIGSSQSNISAIENGASQLGRERAIALARALKVHPSVLLFPDFDMNAAA